MSHHESLRRTFSRRSLTTGALAAAPLAMASRLPAPATARAQDAATVTFWQFSTEEFVIQAYNDAIAAFSEQNPDITVTMEIVPWAEQQQKLITGLTTGSLPDVSMLGNNVVAQFQAIPAASSMSLR